MAAFMAAVFAALDGSERLIIDLRHTRAGTRMFSDASCPTSPRTRLAEPGSLRVLIGPETYSAGKTNAYELRAGARARLYGEPSGGRPNSYGEMRVLALLRSRLEVSYSTEFSRLSESDDPPSVEPDVFVPLASSEWFAGVDPVLERALTD